MKKSSIKVKHYISPKTFAEYYFKTDDKVIRNAEVVSRVSVQRFFDKGFSYLGLKSLLNDDNVLILFDKFKESEQNKHFINLCSLPLDFFETLQKEFPMTTQSLAFNQLAYSIQQKFIKLIMQNIVAQTFTRVVGAGKPQGSVYLHAEPLTFEDFKQTAFFKPCNMCSFEKNFIKVFKRIFSDGFYAETDIIKDVHVIKIFDFRNGNEIEYELLRYSLSDFEFLNHFHADLIKVFVREYFAYILHNNMQQFLKGDKDEV